MDKKETEYKKIEEIYEITPYQKGFWGMRKIEIQKNYEMIQKKIKEKVQINCRSQSCRKAINSLSDLRPYEVRK